MTKPKCFRSQQVAIRQLIKRRGTEAEMRLSMEAKREHWGTEAEMTGWIINKFQHSGKACRIEKRYPPGSKGSRYFGYVSNKPIDDIGWLTEETAEQKIKQFIESAGARRQK